MHVVFRTDASIQIGTGHVMRCLTLADLLREQDISSTFVCRSHIGHLGDLIAKKGHSVILLPQRSTNANAGKKETPTHAEWLDCDWQTDAQETQDALTHMAVDWLVVDHYALDARWENALRHQCDHLMVIDDLADRTHDCDLLLDQNLGRSGSHYKHLVPENACTLIGPRYALLRPEFGTYRTLSLVRRASPKLQHLLVTLGGVDKENLTSEILQTLKHAQLPKNLRITVVMGEHAPALADVRALAKQIPCPTTVLVSIQNMAELMTDSDLVIGAAGGTTWERCSLGLPSLVFVTAANQKTAAQALESIGAIQVIQQPSDLTAIIAHPNISGSAPIQLQQLSEASRHVTDGTGSQCVLQAMRNIYA